MRLHADEPGDRFDRADSPSDRKTDASDGMAKGSARPTLQDTRSALWLQRSAGNAVVAGLVRRGRSKQRGGADSTTVARSGAIQGVEKPQGPDELLPNSEGDGVEHGCAGPMAAPGSPNDSPSASVQRQPAPAASSHLTPDLFEVVGGAMTFGGTVGTTSGPGADPVAISAPDVKMEATVRVKPGKTLGTEGGVMAGPVQDLLGSERTGVYRKGGLPAGDVVAEKRSSETEVLRDARWHKDSAGHLVADQVPPWYSKPDSVSDAMPATFNLYDKPAFEEPRSIGQGIITETKGSDRFVTSVSAKRGDDVVHLKSTNWEVPWALSLSGTGQAVGKAPSSGPAGGGPAVLGGTIAPAAPGTDWVSFPTAESAMGASVSQLIGSVVVAKSRDPASWKNICDALKQKNPQLTVTIQVEKTVGFVGADTVQVSLSGTKSITKGPLGLNNGQSGSVTFGLTDVFDPADLNEGSAIVISAQDPSQKGSWFSSHQQAFTQQWKLPFASQNTPTKMQGPSAGSYLVSATGID